MIAKLELSPKRIYLKTSTVKYNDIIKIKSSTPKNLRQKKKLIKILSPYNGNILYPKGFNTNGYPKPYPLFEMHIRKMLSDFLKECKIKKPKEIIITPFGKIKDSFYFDISEYTGKIILVTDENKEYLKHQLLNHNGTVLQTKKYYNSNNSSALSLTLPTTNQAVLK